MIPTPGGPMQRVAAPSRYMVYVNVYIIIVIIIIMIIIITITITIIIIMIIMIMIHSYSAKRSKKSKKNKKMERCGKCVISSSFIRAVRPYLRGAGAGTARVAGPGDCWEDKKKRQMPIEILCMLPLQASCKWL